MAHQSELISSDINAYLRQQEHKSLLRLLTCGSVDDGKSTLIGRLLHDAKMLYEDQLHAAQTDSRKHGTTGDNVDLALLVDGLQAEREQGITIDVAYRYFSTDKRKFIIADTPGHEQYTRNMATGASTCDLAIILIDARNGVMTQTRRHSYIASLLGIKHIIVAINKMDLVDFDAKVFQTIQADFLTFAASLELPDVQFIPISALAGDNVVELSERMPWYHGMPLMQILESVTISSDSNFSDFRLPIQYVNRPNPDFRGFCGTITAGVVKPGDAVQVLPSGKTSVVDKIVTYDGELDGAFAGQAVTLTLRDEIDISRGDVLLHAVQDTSAVARITRQCRAHLIWMSDATLTPGRDYLFKLASKTTRGRVTRIVHQIDVNTQQQSPAEQLHLNDIAVVDVQLDQAMLIEPYQQRTGLGAFIVIDRISNLTVAAGMVIHSVAPADLISDTVTMQTQLQALLDADLPQAEFEQRLQAILREHLPHWRIESAD